jgi:predicted methyltransferase
MIWLRPSDILAVEAAILARKGSVKISLDLGLTTQEVHLDHGLLIIGENEYAVPALRKDEKTCFFFDEEFTRLRFVGEDTGMIYELVETAGRPMLKVSATPFHKWDFIKRIEQDKPKGDILDAGTGLGYTAIAASATAKHVDTVEMDRNVLRMQELNPWSRQLAKSNITKYHEDIVEVAAKTKKKYDCIILDGGTPRSSGHFFSLENYKNMRRILRGKLYHYLPDKGVTKGRDFPAEVIARLRRAGFRRIERFREQGYVIAQ